MSEIGLNINVDSYNNEGIKTIKGNNNAEIYKLYILKNKRRLSLVGKTVKLGYVMVGTTNGDVIENLNITNAEQGEITFPITNRISKKDGVYSCQLAIYGADGFLEHTATFGLTVEANIFTKIAGEIADSKDFTYLENILDKASKLSEKLKENTSSATNANSNLESNITEANNINSKLLENTSTATGLNKNLESNIDLAKEVKETIKDLDTKNIEATSKIGQLTDLNNKAQELSNNINQALPFNSELVRNTESAKVTNTNLAATNQEATTKNTELQASLEKTKDFINGLDGSQNIPQIRLDVDALQNGLKSNQALAYKGSSINAENTLEGRTEGMRIGGRTLVNLVNIRKMILSKETTFEDDIIKFRKTGSDITYLQIPFLSKPNTTYTIVYTIVKNTVEQPDEQNYILYPDGVLGDFNSTMNTFPKNGQIGLNKICLNSKSTLFGTFSLGFHRVNVGAEIWIKNLMILEGDWTNKEIPDFFEGIKSFGEEEKVEDKYKISILSHTENMANSDININVEPNTNVLSDFYPCYLPAHTPFSFGVLSDNSQNISNMNVRFYDKDKILVDYWSMSSIENRYVDNPILHNRESCYFRVEIPSTNTLKVKFSKACLYLGRNHTRTFPQYEIDKKDILIKEPLRENDVLHEDNGQVKVYRDVKQYTFTGNEEIAKGTSLSNTCLFHLNINRKVGINNIISDKFKTKNVFSVDEEGIFGSANSSTIYIRISKSKLSTPDVEGFKAWLKANPTTIVYQLATPVTEVVENCVDIDLDTFQDKTHFNIENSIKGSLDFKVPSNIASIVQNTAREVNNIWDVINNLLVPSLIDINKNVAMATIKNNLK